MKAEVVLAVDYVNIELQRQHKHQQKVTDGVNNKIYFLLAAWKLNNTLNNVHPLATYLNEKKHRLFIGYFI